MTRRQLLGASLLLANAAVLALWWTWTGPETYLWTRGTTEVTEAVRRAGREVFWWRWPVWAVRVSAVALAVVLLLRARVGQAAVLAGAGLVLGTFVDRLGDRALADEYFLLFQLQERAEPLLTGPLLEAGPAVGPYLLPYVRNGAAGRRRYAIGAIGEIGYAPAVPYLVQLMNDTSEAHYFRADAWEALREIDTDEARTAVSRFEADLARPGADSALVNYVTRAR